jgi:hypothetical protein
MSVHFPQIKQVQSNPSLTQTARRWAYGTRQQSEAGRARVVCGLAAQAQRLMAWTWAGGALLPLAVAIPVCRPPGLAPTVAGVLSGFPRRPSPQPPHWPCAPMGAPTTRPPRRWCGRVRQLRTRPASSSASSMVEAVLLWTWAGVPAFICDACSSVWFVPCNGCGGGHKVSVEEEGRVVCCSECNENRLVCANCCSWSPTRIGGSRLPFHSHC